jgi:hypothetical protein
MALPDPPRTAIRAPHKVHFPTCEKTVTRSRVSVVKDFLELLLQQFSPLARDACRALFSKHAAALDIDIEKTYNVWYMAAWNAINANPVPAALAADVGALLAECTDARRAVCAHVQRHVAELEYYINAHEDEQLNIAGHYWTIEIPEDKDYTDVATKRASCDAIKYYKADFTKHLTIHNRGNNILHALPYSSTDKPYCVYDLGGGNYVALRPVSFTATPSGSVQVTSVSACINEPGLRAYLAGTLDCRPDSARMWWEDDCVSAIEGACPQRVTSLITSGHQAPAIDKDPLKILGRVAYKTNWIPTETRYDYFLRCMSPNTDAHGASTALTGVGESTSFGDSHPRVSTFKELFHKLPCVRMYAHFLYVTGINAMTKDQYNMCTKRAYEEGATAPGFERFVDCMQESLKQFDVPVLDVAAYHGRPAKPPRTAFVTDFTAPLKTNKGSEYEEKMKMFYVSKWELRDGVHVMSEFDSNPFDLILSWPGTTDKRRDACPPTCIFVHAKIDGESTSSGWAEVMATMAGDYTGEARIKYAYFFPYRDGQEEEEYQHQAHIPDFGACYLYKSDGERALSTDECIYIAQWKPQPIDGATNTYCLTVWHTIKYTRDKSILMNDRIGDWRLLIRRSLPLFETDERMKCIRKAELKTKQHDSFETSAMWTRYFYTTKSTPSVKRMIKDGYLAKLAEEGQTGLFDRDSNILPQRHVALDETREYKEWRDGDPLLPFVHGGSDAINLVGQRSVGRRTVNTDTKFFKAYLTINLNLDGDVVLQSYERDFLQLVQFGSVQIAGFRKTSDVPILCWIEFNFNVPMTPGTLFVCPVFKTFQAQWLTDKFKETPERYATEIRDHLNQAMTYQ